MQHLFQIVGGIAVLVFFVWLLIPSSSSAGQAGSSTDDQVIDPSDSTQIGMLIGMTGGTIADAAVARFALQRFEEIHGRKATVRDMGTVAGLISTM